MSEGVGLKTARMLKIYNFLRESRRLAFIPEELGEILDVPLRTLYEYLNELLEEGLVEKINRDGRVAYRATVYPTLVDTVKIELEPPFVTIATSTLPETIHSTKIDEIVSRFRYMKKFKRQGGKEKLREIIADYSPQKLWEMTKSELKSDDKLLALYPWITKKELDVIEIKGDSFIIPQDRVPNDELTGVFIGSDGSLNKLDLVFQIFQIPAMMNLIFTSASTVKIAINNGRKVKIDPKYEIQRRPAYPLYSAEDYVEDLGTAFPYLSEGERNMVAYTMLDIVHFGLDHDAIKSALVGVQDASEDLNPVILFHDGRLMPSNIHYMDLLGLHPRSNHPQDRARTPRATKTWDALAKTVEVRHLAEIHNVLAVGVVKRPAKPYFAMMIDKLLSEAMGFPRGELRNDALAMGILLKPNESSCVVSIKPDQINIGDPSSISGAKRILQRDYATYKEYLTRLKHWAFYLNSHDYVCRYEFFDSSESPDEVMRGISKYALTLASQSPRGDSSDLHSPKRMEVTPSPIVAADFESNEWGKKISSMLESHLLRALSSMLKR